MKKILFILVLFMLTACETSIKPVENPAKVTTLEVLNAPADTMLVAVVDDVLYTIDIKKREVVHRQEDARIVYLTLGILIGVIVGIAFIMFIID